MGTYIHFTEEQKEIARSAIEFRVDSKLMRKMREK